MFDINPENYDGFIITSTGELNKVSELSWMALYAVFLIFMCTSTSWQKLYYVWIKGDHCVALLIFLYPSHQFLQETDTSMENWLSVSTSSSIVITSTFQDLDHTRRSINLQYSSNDGHSGRYMGDVRVHVWYNIWW